MLVSLINYKLHCQPKTDTWADAWPKHQDFDLRTDLWPIFANIDYAQYGENIYQWSVKHRNPQIWPKGLFKYRFSGYSESSEVNFQKVRLFSRRWRLLIFKNYVFCSTHAHFILFRFS
jgi:hypothetical protein